MGFLSMLGAVITLVLVAIAKVFLLHDGFSPPRHVLALCVGAVGTFASRHVWSRPWWKPPSPPADVLPPDDGGASGTVPLDEQWALSPGVPPRPAHQGDAALSSGRAQGGAYALPRVVVQQLLDFRSRHPPSGSPPPDLPRPRPRGAASTGIAAALLLATPALSQPAHSSGPAPVAGEAAFLVFGVLILVLVLGLGLALWALSAKTFPSDRDSAAAAAAEARALAREEAMEARFLRLQAAALAAAPASAPPVNPPAAGLRTPDRRERVLGKGLARQNRILQRLFAAQAVRVAPRTSLAPAPAPRRGSSTGAAVAASPCHLGPVSPPAVGATAAPPSPGSGAAASPSSPGAEPRSPTSPGLPPPVAPPPALVSDSPGVAGPALVLPEAGAIESPSSADPRPPGSPWMAPPTSPTVLTASHGSNGTLSDADLRAFSAWTPPLARQVGSFPVYSTDTAKMRAQRHSAEADGARKALQAHLTKSALSTLGGQRTAYAAIESPLGWLVRDQPLLTMVVSPEAQTFLKVTPTPAVRVLGQPASTLWPHRLPGEPAVTFQEFHELLRLLVRPKLEDFITGFQEHLSAFYSLPPCSGKAQELLSLAEAAILRACTFYTPQELADYPSFSSRILKASLADSVINSELLDATRGLPMPPLGCTLSPSVADELTRLQLMRTRLSSLGLKAKTDSEHWERKLAERATKAGKVGVVAAVDAWDTDGWTTVVSHSAPSVAAGAGAPPESRRVTVPNNDATDCPNETPDRRCYMRYLTRTKGTNEPHCVRKGHGPMDAATAKSASTHRNRLNSFTKKRDGASAVVFYLTLATIALLPPEAESLTPPPVVPDVLWVHSVAAALERHHVAAAAATDTASLVTAPMRSGTSTFNALIDGGATASCIASSLAARLASEGRLALTGRSISISSVAGETPRRFPTGTFTFEGDTPEGVQTRAIEAAIVPSLLSGHDIEALFPARADPTRTMADFWRLTPRSPPATWRTPRPAVRPHARAKALIAAAAIILASGSPTPLPVGLRPATLDDLRLAAPDQHHWPAGFDLKVLRVVNDNLAAFAPVDTTSRPLDFPSQHVETTSDRPYNAYYNSCFTRYSDPQYRHFQEQLRDNITSGIFSWVDHAGYEVRPRPDGLGPSDIRTRPDAPPPATPWIHAPVYASKGGDAVRIAVDFRRLNARAVPMAQDGMPSCDATLSSLSGALLYSQVDAANFHFQIPVVEADRHKSCFGTPMGTVRLNCLGQGFVNSSIIAQQVMEGVMQPLTSPLSTHRPQSPSLDPPAALVRGIASGRSTAEGYQDDGAIATGDPRPLCPGDHIPADVFAASLHDLDVLLRNCVARGLQLAWGKCRFIQEHLDYLGERLSREGRTIDPTRLKEIADLAPPTSYAEAASALGFFSFFRRYVTGFSDLVARFTSTPEFRTAIADPKPADSRRAPLALTQEQLLAWDELKSALLQDITLAPMDHAHPVFIYADGSHRGMGAVILVGPDRRPFGFMSLALDKAQRNYTVPDREALAGYTVITRHARALRGARVVWVTDHDNLHRLADIHRTGAKDIASSRLRRWFDALYLDLDITLIIVHIPGVEMQRVGADALSRLVHSPPEDTPFVPDWLAAAMEPHPESVLSAAREVRQSQHVPVPDESPPFITAATLSSAWDTEEAEAAATAPVAAATRRSTRLRADAPPFSAPTLVPSPAEIARLGLLPPLPAGSRPTTPLEPRPPRLASPPSPFPAVIPASHATVVPTHLSASPDLLRISEAQAAAPLLERRGWEQPPFASGSVNGVPVVRRRGRAWLPSGNRTLKEDLLEAAHVATGWAGGPPAIVEQLHRARVDWFDLRGDARRWACSSPMRQMTATPRVNGPRERPPQPRGAFAPTLSPHPDNTVYADFVPGLSPEPSPLDPGGPPHTCILLLMDPFTRWVQATSHPSADGAASVAALTLWASEHGPPVILRTDNGSHFKCGLVSAWASSNGVQHITGVPQHHSGQGMVERRVPLLRRLLVTLSTASEAWTDCLPLATRILNDTVVRSTGHSPFEARFGHPRRSSLQASLALDGLDDGDTFTDLDQSLASRDSGRRLDLLASSVGQLDSAARHDASVSAHPSFLPGDYVLFLEDTPRVLDPVGSIFVVREARGPSHYLISRPLTPLDTREAPAQRLRAYDATRTDIQEDAVAECPAGTRLVTGIVSHQGAAAHGTVTFTVRFSDSTRQHHWQASSLHKLSVWRPYCRAHGLPITPSSIAYSHTPPIPEFPPASAIAAPEVPAIAAPDVAPSLAQALDAPPLVLSGTPTPVRVVAHSALPVTFTVELSDGSYAHNWKATALHALSLLAAYALAHGLPPSPLDSAYKRGPGRPPARVGMLN